MMRSFCLLLVVVPAVMAQFEGTGSAECVALTWDQTRDRGNTVYRLTEGCSSLFSCPAGTYCPAGAYITSAGEDDALAYFMDTWSPDTRRCRVVRGFSNTTYSYACDCGFGFWCARNTAIPRFCPKQYYCRRPSTISGCKVGHYCKEGSVFGRRCTRLSKCPRKSPRPKGSGGSVVIFVVLILLVFVIFRVFYAMKEMQMQRANQDMEDYLEALRAREVEKKRFENYHDDEEKQPSEAVFEMIDVEKKATDELHIEFKDVRFVLPSGVTIMRGPCGEFKPGRSCAIMGASGAGKTTIMNLVTGKVKKTSGSIYVNGEECESLEKWKSRVAFVPQEDVMHRRLTVLQNVAFSAYLRLPTTTDDAYKHKKINETLVSLNLDKIKHSIIGDEYQRGISGGQRKRVNVALELVADPKVLFMDEPTSGLDSVSATELCQMLRTLAESGNLTIAAVIHSPGPATFAAFHDFMLLQTGGRPVYMGPMPEVEAYFASIGFKYDGQAMVDPLADYVMKAVAGTHFPDPSIATLRICDDDMSSEELEAYYAAHWDPLLAFHELWHKKIGKPKPTDQEMEDLGKAKHKYARMFQALAISFFVTYPKEVLRQLCPSSKADPERPTPNSLQIFVLCYRRACRQIYVSVGDFLISSVVVFFAIGAFMAALSPTNLNVLGRYPEDLCSKQIPGLRSECRDLQQNSYVSALQFVGFIVCAANSAIAAATFGAEQPIYWREASTNLNTPAYFFAKVVADVPVAVIHALAVSAGFLTGFVSPMAFSDLYAGMLLVTCFGYLSGYFLSFTLPYTACGLAGVGWAVFWMLLYGGTTKLMSDDRPNRWVWALSAGRWANEAWFDAATVYPYEKVHQGPEKGEDLFDMSRQKQDYLFYLHFGPAIGWGFFTLLCLLIIDLFLITATKLDKKH